MDWFLYDRGLRHERVNSKWEYTKQKNSVFGPQLRSVLFQAFSYLALLTSFYMFLPDTLCFKIAFLLAIKL